MEISTIASLYLPLDIIKYAKEKTFRLSNNFTIIFVLNIHYSMEAIRTLKKQISEYANLPVCILPPDATNIMTYDNFISYIVEESGETALHIIKSLNDDSFKTVSIRTVSGENQMLKKHIMNDKYFIIHDRYPEDLHQYTEYIYDIKTGKLLCTIENWYTDFIDGDILYTFRNYDKVMKYDINTGIFETLPLDDHIPKSNICQVEFHKGLNIFAIISSNYEYTRIYYKTGKLLYKMRGGYYFSGASFICGGMATGILLTHNNNREEYAINEAFMIKLNLNLTTYSLLGRKNKASNIVAISTTETIGKEGNYRYILEGYTFLKINSEKIYEKHLEQQVQQLRKLC